MYLELTRVNKDNKEVLHRELILFGPGGADQIKPAEGGKRTYVSFPNGATPLYDEPYEVIKKALAQHMGVVVVDFEKPVEMKAIRI